MDEFIYYVNENLLKGKNILTITNYNLPKSDKFYFTDGIFNLKEKNFQAKTPRPLFIKIFFLEIQMIQEFIAFLQKEMKIKQY